jgi:hypothetical protein
MTQINNQMISNTPKVANLTIQSKPDRNDDEGSFQDVSHCRMSNAACMCMHTSPDKLSQNDSMRVVGN